MQHFKNQECTRFAVSAEASRPAASGFGAMIDGAIQRAMTSVVVLLRVLLLHTYNYMLFFSFVLHF